MTEIKFNPVIRRELIEKLQRYCNDELEFELEQFDADFMLDFIAQQMGPHFYNQALADAQTSLQENLTRFEESLYELEKETPQQ